MRLVFLVPLVVALCISAFGIGLYAGVKRTWPVPQLKGLVAKLTEQATGKDQFGRLLSYPGKIEIACPSQDQMTAVLLLIGQSNAANYQGQRHQSGDDRVINFSAGHCYRAASPLLGADGELGETWTLLGTKLIRSGLYRTVILIPAAVGGSAIHRWADGGDLNTMMVAVIQAAKIRYTITGVLLNQGAADFILHTPEDQYRSDLDSLINTIRAQGVSAPIFITRSSNGGKAGRKIIPSPKRKRHWLTAGAPFSTVPTPTMMSLRSIAMTASTLPPAARKNTPTPGYACFVRTQGCNWSRALTAIVPHLVASWASGRQFPAREALRPLRDPLEDTPHGRRFPFAAPRCGNASPVESGGDLTERLRPCSLGLSNSWRDSISMRVGPAL